MNERERELENLIDRALSDYKREPSPQLAERVLSKVRCGSRPVLLSRPAGWIKAAAGIAAAVLTVAFIVHGRLAAPTHTGTVPRQLAKRVPPAPSADVAAERVLGAARSGPEKARHSVGLVRVGLVRHAKAGVLPANDAGGEAEQFVALAPWAEPTTMKSASLESVTIAPPQLATISEESLPMLREYSPRILQ